LEDPELHEFSSNLKGCPYETLRLTGLFPGRKNDKDIKAYKKECAVNAVNRNDSTDFSVSGKSYQSLFLVSLKQRDGGLGFAHIIE
jgi:hypothetical protein